MVKAHVLAIGTALPPVTMTAPQFDGVIDTYADPSPASKKTKAINHRTEIHTRRSVQEVTSPLFASPSPPTIDAVNDLYMDLGVKMAVEAARNALADWGGKAEQITHLVSTTCTSNSYPGFDHYLASALKLPSSLHKTLISGVGCSGGLAILRIAKTIAEGDPRARVLCVACEVTSSLMRTEIQSMVETGLPNVPVVLFADGSSALIVGAEPRYNEKSDFEIIRTHVETIPNTQRELAFDIHSTGWRAVITPKVPIIIGTMLPALIKSFLDRSKQDTAQYDWFIHPGGAAILSSVEQSLGLKMFDHSRASWEVYQERGNMSSASIGHVMEVGRRVGGREDIMGVAFGPGVTIEVVQLRRPTPAAYPLARPRYIEMHEQPWCPPLIRERVQRILTMMWTTRIWPVQSRAPVDCVVEVLEEVVDQIQCTTSGKKEDLTVVDFCSGDGGPMRSVSNILNQRRHLASDNSVPFLLTDLYPPARLPASTPDFIYHPASVDATSPSTSLLKGVGKHIRTFCLAFHHFPDKQAKEVLQAGMIESDAICIFELQEFNLISWLVITLMGPLTLLLTPLTQPSLATLFFTYAVPIIPFIAVVDGYVSSIRTRDMKHMQFLIDQAAASSNLIDSSEWTWEQGRKKHMPIGAMWYLKGIRRRAKATNGH